MVFADILAAHHALTAKSVGHFGAKSLGGAGAHTQSLDGAGSGCGPMGNNCSGEVPKVHDVATVGNSRGLKLGDYPTENATTENGTVNISDVINSGTSTSQIVGHTAGGYFGDHAALNHDHHYTMTVPREDSQQAVSYHVPSDYTDYAHTGMHTGLFKFHGVPDPDNTASSMIAPQADGGVQATTMHHAFGNDLSEASAMYIPPEVANVPHTLNFYGHAHGMNMSSPSIISTNAVPEQVPEGPPTGYLPGQVPHTTPGEEAKFIMGDNRHSLNTATSLVKSGQATPSMTAKFISSHSYSYSSSPSTDVPYGVAFATQTLRTANANDKGVTDGPSDVEGVDNYGKNIARFNKSAAASSAYSFIGPIGSKIRDHPYHPAAAAYCDLYPDKCFFAPQPATQGIAGGYHSI